MPDVATLDSSDILNLLDAIAVKSQKITEAIKGTGETSTKHMKSAGEAVSGLDKSVSSLSKSLLGPVGLAAGFVAVAKSLDNFAVGQLQLQNLAKNTGLAASTVLQLQSKFSVAGLSVQEFNAQLGGLTSALDNIKTFKEGSDVFGKIAQGMSTIGGVPLENVILNFEKMGNRMGSIDAILKSYNRGTAEWKLYLEGVFHTNAAGMEAMKEDLAGVIQLTQGNEAQTRQWHREWISLSNILTNVWTNISGAALTELNKITGGMEKLNATSKTVTDNIVIMFKDNVGPAIATTVGEVVGIIAKLNDLEKWMTDHGLVTKGGGDIVGQLVAPYTPGPHNLFSQSGPGNQPRYLLEGEGGPEQSLWQRLKSKMFGSEEDDGALPKNARPRMFSPSNARAGDTLDMSARAHTEEDSNKLLRDIRDIMQRAEIKTLGGGGGGGGGSGGFGGTGVGAGRGTTFRSGIRGGTGATDAPPMGDTAGAGPGQSDFLAKQRAGYKAELADSPETRELVAGMLSSEDPGNRTSAVESLFNRTTLVNEERAKKGLPPLSVRDMIMGHPSIDKGKSFYGPVRSGAIQSHISRLRRDPEHARRMYGLTDEALGGSHRIGGYTDQGSPGDPNYETGGGITFPNRERYGDWRYPGVQAFRQRQQAALAAEDAARSAGAAGMFKERQYQLEGEGGRAALNQSMQGAAPNGHLTADVTFGNVPPGVRTNAEGKGFKTLRVTSSKQNQKAAEGLLGPGDMTYTPFVP